MKLALRLLGRSLLVGLLGASLGCSTELRPPAQVGLNSQGAATPRRGGTLRLSIVDDVRTLDPAIATDEFSISTAHLLFDTLLDYGPASSPDPLALVPELAETWSVSADGRLYSFTLRPALRFASGQPVVAGDFVYAITRVLAPETASPGQSFFMAIEGAREFAEGRASRVAGLRALDDRHLEIALAEREPTFPLRLAMPFATPLSRRLIEEAPGPARDRPVGTGPFRVEEWRQGERMVLVRNPHYWNPDRPYLDRIEMELAVPANVAAVKFELGQVDVLDHPVTDDYLRFARAPSWAPYILRSTQAQVFGEGMNVTRPPFDRKLVRQALNYAINKYDSVALLNGRAIIASGVLPPTVPGYDPDLPPYPHDPVKARQLLAAAGYPNGLDVTYTTIPDATLQLLAQSIQADLAEVGVRMKIVTVTFPTYYAAAGRGELDFFFTGWLMDFPDPWDFLELLFHSRMIAPENASNVTRYSNPVVDSLLDAARVALVPAERMTMYRAAQKTIHDDCPWVFHYHPLSVEVRQPRVMNYTPHPVWPREHRNTWLVAY